MTGPRRASSCARRALLVLLGWVLLLLAWAPSASAAPIGARDTLGQTPPALSWINLKDSRGISMWQFEMSLDRGGVTSPDKFFWSAWTDSCWGIYRGWCALALWFLDWVLSFTWVATIAAPLMAVGDAMQQVVTRLGVVPTALTLSALMAGFWLLKGRRTTAVWEVGTACVIAALASGVFADPVQMIAGPSGYIVKANQSGQQLAAALATGDAAGKTPDQLRHAQTGMLVDTFIRQPTQMINFGRVLDGGKCEGAYNDVIKAGPYGYGSDIRDKVSDCDKSLGEYAANPSAPMALGSLVFFPAAFVILFMCLVLGGSVIGAAVWAMYQSLKAVVAFVTGLLPGGGRGSLMLTAAETIVSLLILVFTSIFLSVFLLVIQAMFAGSTGEAIPKTFVIVDVLIVAGMVVYLRQRRQLKAATQRLARWMSQRPGGATATRLPERVPGIGMGAASSAVRTATGLAQLRAQRAAASRPAGGPLLIDNRRQAAMIFFPFPRRGDGGAPPSPGPHLGPDPAGPGPLQLTGRPDQPQLPPGSPDGPPPPAPSGSGLQRIQGRRKVAGALVRAGTHAALAYVTGGASTALTRGTKVVSVGKTARRAALAKKLASTGNAKGSTPPRGKPGPARPMGPRTKQSPVPTPTPSSRASQAVVKGQVVPTPPVRSAPASPGKAPSTRTGKAGASAGKIPPPSRASRPTPGPGPAAGQSRTDNTRRADQLRQRLADRSRRPDRPT